MVTVCYVSIIFVCLLATSSVIASSRINPNVNDSYKIRHTDSQRIRRATKGTGVLGKLVGTARHLYSNGNSNVFVKKGRYTDAVSDFYSLKPTRVRTKQMKGKVKLYGYIGKKTIIVQKDASGLTLTVTDKIPNVKLSSTKLHPETFQTIVYTN